VCVCEVGAGVLCSWRGCDFFGVCVCVLISSHPSAVCPAFPVLAVIRSPAACVGATPPTRRKVPWVCGAHGYARVVFLCVVGTHFERCTLCPARVLTVLLLFLAHTDMTPYETDWDENGCKKVVTFEKRYDGSTMKVTKTIRAVKKVKRVNTHIERRRVRYPRRASLVPSVCECVSVCVFCLFVCCCCFVFLYCIVFLPIQFPSLSLSPSAWVLPPCGECRVCSACSPSHARSLASYVRPPSHPTEPATFR
jgi:hypothetical protein